MRLAILAALTVMFAVPAFAQQPAPGAPDAPAPKSAAMRYRTLEKMLRRFAAQAGTASTGKVFASR
jgi:hypothetical protein